MKNNKGKIIFLNGVTSSGKTSIAKALQEKYNERLYHISNDMFHDLEWEMLHAKHINEDSEHYGYGDKFLAESLFLMYHFVKTVADQGINIVVDGMLFEYDVFVEMYGKSHYEIMKNILSDYRIFLVEVYCPLDECRRRNLTRGDRGENQSQEQHEAMNKNIRYDFFVDTSVDDTNTCAEKILKNWSENK